MHLSATPACGTRTPCESAFSLWCAHVTLTHEWIVDEQLVGNVDGLAKSSVARLGDLLHFGQFFKACGNNYIAQIAIYLGNFCKFATISHFSSELIFGYLL